MLEIKLENKLRLFRLLRTHWHIEIFFFLRSRINFLLTNIDAFFG